MAAGLHPMTALLALGGSCGRRDRGFDAILLPVSASFRLGSRTQ